VDDVSSVNYGIWHAAIASSKALKEHHGIESWLVSKNFDASFRQDEFPWLNTFTADSLSASAAASFFAGFKPEDSLIASHGCWQFPTRWAAAGRKAGFAWVYTPHGMLEPWSMEQKAWKKIPYFHLAEKPLAGKASLVRAVGKPELENLKKYFPDALLIPNGIYGESLQQREQDAENSIRNNFVFLARLHHKKNLMPLLHAWIASDLAGRADCRLRIAGTDDGEKQALEDFILRHPDAGISFLGPVFGKEKTQLFRDSDFYILPSLSEGFPTSVVEAAAAGLICLISQGCNFPEILESPAGIDSGITVESIRKSLELAIGLSAEERMLRRRTGTDLVQAGYLWNSIADRQAELYERLLPEEK